jgi:hypothetical protein
MVSLPRTFNKRTLLIFSFLTFGFVSLLVWSFGVQDLQPGDKSGFRIDDLARTCAGVVVDRESIVAMYDDNSVDPLGRVQGFDSDGRYVRHTGSGTWFIETAIEPGLSVGPLKLFRRRCIVSTRLETDPAK